MSLLDSLAEEKVWQEYYAYKKERAHLSGKDDELFIEFINNKEYIEIAQRIIKQGYCFDYPEKKLVNKIETGKKRVVYSFASDENMILKLMSYLLYEYDSYLCDNCYSFRKHFGVLRAVRRFTSVRNISEMYSYKLDISNYFNSIDTRILTEQLDGMMGNDRPLYDFLYALLNADGAYSDGELIHEKRGAMAGIPISPFFANIYLNELDRWFCERNILYARYSDDIIIFARGRDEIEDYRKTIHTFLDRYHLSVNPSKEKLSLPHETWEFLGIAYTGGKIDLSQATIEKMKGKIRRKARSLYRWRVKKGATPEQAQKVMIRLFNSKFYETSDSHELNWSKWFFPMLTVTDGLRTIDHYTQQYIRYIATGRHSKANYRTEYGEIKKLGYRSLVHEYYAYHQECIR